MANWLAPSLPGQVLYPDSDGKPRADNTLQFRWIGVLHGNISVLVGDDPNVFVAGDLLWYPVEGEPEVRQVPDLLAAFGRPRGDRGSYQQWLEDGIAPQVVFEVLSPGNTAQEMADKFDFYEQYGVEEYYVLDPQKNRLEVYQRHGTVLRRVRPVEGWVSPRLGIRFDLSVTPMVVYRPDGQPFLTFEQLEARARSNAERADKAEQEVQLIRDAAEKPEREARLAQQEAQKVRELAERMEQRNARLAEKLRQLGIDPDSLNGP